MEGKVEERDGGEEQGNVGIGEVRELMGMGWAWTKSAERHQTASMANHYLRCHSRGGDRQVPGEVNKGGYRIA